MTGGAILGLLSLLVGAIGLAWAGINSEIFVKANTAKILDNMFSIQEQLDIVNESITEGFLNTYQFLHQENCFNKVHDPT